MQRGQATGLEPTHPAMSALARDPHRLGDMSDRLPAADDSLNEQASAMERETSITVSHEDLR